MKALRVILQSLFVSALLLAGCNRRAADTNAADANANASAPAADGGAVAVTEEKVAVPAGPGQQGTIDLDTSLYVPASATAASPAPAVLVAHGFGGSKASVDSDARELAARGYVVQTWTARGFGASDGSIGLDDPDREVADASRLVDRLAARAAERGICVQVCELREIAAGADPSPVGQGLERPLGSRVAQTVAASHVEAVPA